MRSDLPGQLELPIEGYEPVALRDMRTIIGLVTPKELAAALGNTEQTLADWRCNGKGPIFVKLGKGVFYRMSDVHAWVDGAVTPQVTTQETP